MVQPDMKQGIAYFDEANRLWFNEGYTAQAIAKYKKALQFSGDDPVIAFQLASAFWLLGNKDEALTNLAIAERQRGLLGEKGKRQVDLFRARVATESPPRTRDGRLGAGFDIERLAQIEPSRRDWDWLGVALDAQRLGLIGVALAAYGLYPERSLDPDLLRDEEDLRLDAEQEWRILREMHREMRR